MAFLLDTYNILHAGVAMRGPLGNLSVYSLCRWIQAVHARSHVTLVMDGRAKPDEPGVNEFPDLNLIYSGTGISADSVIAQIVERSTKGPARKKLIVVTNDRAVATHARRCGAKAQACEVFLSNLITSKRLAKGGKHSTALPAQKMEGIAHEGQTEHWLRFFGLSDSPGELTVPAAVPAPRKVEKTKARDKSKPREKAQHVDLELRAIEELDIKKLLGF